MQTFGLGAPPFNIYSLGGMILVEGLALVPSAFLILAPAARNLDPSLEESALVSGANTGQLVFRIILPLLLPVLAGTAIFLMIVSFVVFDVPGTIGMPSRIFVLSSQIYSLVADSPRGIPEYGKVSAMALMFTVGLLVLTLAYHRLMRHAGRFVTVTGRGYRPRPFALGRLRWVAIAAVGLYFLCAVLAPLLILLWTSLMPFQVPPSFAAAKMATLANHREFFSNPFIEAATINSIVVALVAATAVAALSLATAWVSIRTPRAGTARDRRARLPPARHAGGADRDRAGLRLPGGEDHPDLRHDLDHRGGLSHHLSELRLAHHEWRGAANPPGARRGRAHERRRPAGHPAPRDRAAHDAGAGGGVDLGVRPLPARAHRRAAAARRRQRDAADTALHLLVGRRDQQGRRRRACGSCSACSRSSSSGSCCSASPPAA